MYCTPKCLDAGRKVKCEEKHDALPFCSTPQCRGKATRVGAHRCEKCYCAARRNGGVVPPAKVPAYRYVSSAGYVVLSNRDHPLSMGEGNLRRVAEHRVVAFDTHGGECPPCFWCGVPLLWADSVIDHLNEVKSDNSPDNLAVSCNPCNRARGSLLPFILRMTEVGFLNFLTQADLHRARRNPAQRGE